MQNGTHQALRLLGRGSAADTWLFRDFKLSRPVAVSYLLLRKELLNAERLPSLHLLKIPFNSAGDAQVSVHTALSKSCLVADQDVPKTP